MNFRSGGFVGIITVLGIAITTFLLLHSSQSILLALIMFFFSALMSLVKQSQESRKFGFSYLLLGNFWITLGFVLIFFISPIIILSTNVIISREFENYDWKSGLGNAVLLGALALFSLTFGDYLIQSRQKRNYLVQYLENREVSMARTWVLVSIATIAYLVYISQKTGLKGIITTRQYDAIQGLEFGIGYLKDAPIFCLGIFLVNFLAEKFKAKKTISVGVLFWISLSCVYLIPYLSKGSRSIFVYILVVVLIMQLIFSEQRLKKRTFIVLLIVLPLLIVSPRIYRSATDLSVSKITEGYSAQSVLETFTGPDTQMAPALSILHQNLNQKVSYQYGKSYLAALGKPIPRTLWPSKPEEFDTGLNRNLFPSIYRYYGVSFSAVSEPLVNFGLAGVVFFFTLLGSFNAYLRNRLDKRSIRNVFVYSWIVAFMFILARGNLTTDYHRVVFPLMAGLLVLRKKKTF